MWISKFNTKGEVAACQFTFKIVILCFYSTCSLDSKLKISFSEDRETYFLEGSEMLPGINMCYSYAKYFFLNLI